MDRKDNFPDDLKGWWGKYRSTTPTVESGASSTVDPGPSSSNMEADTSKDCVKKLLASKEGGDVSPGRASPDAGSSCPICLSVVVNKSFTDSCMHEFCFTCLKQWSEVKAECPLCKQSFKSIYHDVHSIEDFQQYMLPLVGPLPTQEIFMVNFPPSSEWLNPNRFRTSGQEVSTYLNYVARLERTRSFYALPRVRNYQRTSQRRPNCTSQFRRSIYQRGLWAQRQTDVTGRVRECSPEFYRVNPTMVHRLVPWLNRELNVLCCQISEQVMQIILDLILKVPIRSPEFTNQIARYIGLHTDHFVHEFYSYATTPYDLVGYDREANYVRREELAHNMFRPTSLDTSTDEDVEVVSPWPASRTAPINIGTDSDDCVIVDSVQRSNPPEVITLESDDDVQQLPSTSTNSATVLQQEPSSSTWPPEYGSEALPPTPKRRRLRLSININLPDSGPSRLLSGYRRNHRWYRSPVETDSSSGPEFFNKRKKERPPKKTLKKKPKPSTSKGKAKDSSGSSPRSEESVVSDEPTYGKGRRRATLVKHRHRPNAINSSSDEDEASVLQIHAEPELLALVEPKTLDENKRRLKSVVVKPEVKTETQDVSDLPSSSSHVLPVVKTENKYCNSYSSSDLESSDTSSVSSYQKPFKRFVNKSKLSKK